METKLISRVLTAPACQGGRPGRACSWGGDIWWKLSLF